MTASLPPLATLGRASNNIYFLHRLKFAPSSTDVNICFPAVVNTALFMSTTQVLVTVKG